MKIVIKLMLLALVGLLVAPFLLKGPDGRPIMSFDSFGLDLFTSASPSAYQSPSKSTSKLTTVYKWQDDQGQWHFSDKTIEGDNHQTVKYNPKANIIQSLPKDDNTQSPSDTREYIGSAISHRTGSKQTAGRNEDELEVLRGYKRANGSNTEDDSGMGFGLTTVPMAQIPELIEKAKAVQGLLDQRQANMDKALAK